MAVVLFSAAAALLYANHFIRGEVEAQLAPQNIMMPAENSASFKALSPEDQEAIRPFAGEKVTTGAQAKVFADNYIAAHIKTIGGGKSYSELSNESRANPSDVALAEKVNTVFKGETLRGMLLNAYAFDTMAVIAKYAAVGSLVAGTVLTILAVLGFGHAKKASTVKRKR